MWLNGLPLELVKDTAVRRARKPLSISELSRIGTNNFAGSIPPSSGPAVSSAIPSINELVSGDYLEYSGASSSSGHFVARRITIIRHNAIDQKMASLARVTAPSIVEPQYETHRPGAIQYKFGPPIEIVANREVQMYVQGVGNGLVPAYQKALADTDPAKFIFRFYVVRPFDSLGSDKFIQIDGQAPKTTMVGYDGVLSPFVLSVDRLPVDRIVEMPDGTVLIPTTALARLRNKAQLAFALSVAIQSVLQRLEGTATEILRHGQERVNTDIPAPVGFIETQQAMRLGIRYMYLAGFDIREAPFAWIDEHGQQVSNPVINVTNPDDHFCLVQRLRIHLHSPLLSGCGLQQAEARRGGVPAVPRRATEGRS